MGSKSASHTLKRLQLIRSCSEYHECRPINLLSDVYYYDVYEWPLYLYCRYTSFLHSPFREYNLFICLEIQYSFFRPSCLLRSQFSIILGNIVIVIYKLIYGAKYNFFRQCCPLVGNMLTYKLAVAFATSSAYLQSSIVT